MEDCTAMHLCWTFGPLHRQKLILAYMLKHSQFGILEWLQENAPAAALLLIQVGGNN